MKINTTLFPPSQQRLHKLCFMQKLGCQKPCWEQARLSSLVNKQVSILASFNLSISRADYMHYFLLYGRQLSQKEVDKLEQSEKAVKKEAPGLDKFREQIDHYEALHEEVRGLDNSLNLQGWFQADVSPFKYALMNCIKRWSYAFKKHLLDHLIRSLEELNSFIEKADEALMMQVREGDYEGLIKVMEYLALVSARQRATDSMFEPLQDLIDC